MQATKTPLPVDQTKIDQCVEALSLKGCEAVTEIICALERGAYVADMLELTEMEKQATLAELKSIMAVYQARK